MKLQSKTTVQTGLGLIRMGSEMIASAEISEPDVLEAFNRGRNGDPRLYRQLSQKIGFIDIVMALFPPSLPPMQLTNN